jgi:hypothetical protein
MADKDKKKDDVLVETKIDEKKEGAGNAPPSQPPAAALSPAAPKEPAPVMRFERWLSATGKAAHWKHGMAAFADISGKKTAEQWAAIFETY